MRCVYQREIDGACGEAADNTTTHPADSKHISQPGGG